MDPLDPAYLALLLEEATRQVAMLGDGFGGVAQDRGWPQLFNPLADDGRSFCEDAPGKTCRCVRTSL